MPKRTYKQHCALARALDAVGERWTLLLVRELLTGPKRYKDLQQGLPGMGTNLLADRLKELVEGGLILRCAHGYSLTPRGAQLEEAIIALARFGAPLLGQRKPDEHWSASWNVVALKYAFNAVRAKTLEGVIEYRIDGSTVQARVDRGTIATASGPRWNPDVVATADGDTFLGIASGEVDPDSAERAGTLLLEGSRRVWRGALRAFGPG